MKTLLVLRHAKSSWKQPGLPDHDRPLNKRGRRDAPRVGRWLAETGLRPDLIVSSTARRAKTTAELVAEALGYDGEIIYEPRIYHAEPTVLIDVLRELPDTVDTVLLVGHNPGLEALVAILSDQWERMPTAALARLELDIEHWHQLTPRACAADVEVWRPKEHAE